MTDNNTYPILTAEQFMSSKHPRRSTILHPWLKEKSIVLISAWRGVGKTWFALSIADCISRGRSFGPWYATTSCNVLYVDGEMAIDDINDRLKVLEYSSTVDVQDIQLYRTRKKQLYILSSELVSTHGITEPNITDTWCQSAIFDICKEHNIKLIVLDNSSSLTRGIDENSKREWDPINQWFLSLRFAGISVMLLHHHGLSGAQRGTTSREDHVDTSIQLDRMRGSQENVKFKVQFTKNRVESTHHELIKPCFFTLITDTKNRLKWEWNREPPELSRLRECITRIWIEKEFSSGELAASEALGVSKPYLSKLKKQLVNQGLLKGDTFIGDINNLHGFWTGVNK